MQAVLNREVFSTRLFDSGALGVLASVIHQFAEPAIYGVVVRRGDIVVHTLSFEVSAASQNLQLDIDLATSIRDRAGREESCTCAPAGTEKHGVMPREMRPTVSPKGYVLFYVSRGEGGLSVQVGTNRSNQPVFDSTTLGKGDLFALSLLAPTKYSMENRLGRARGMIEVSMPEAAFQSLADLEPIAVEATRDAFAPPDVKASSGQGIVFRVVDAARIVIEQTQDPPDDEPRRRRRIVVPKRPAPSGPHR